MTNTDQLLSAVKNSNGTAEAVADEAGISPVYARRLLRSEFDDGTLDREKEGRTFVYSLADGASDESQATLDGDEIPSKPAALSKDADASRASNVAGAPDRMPVNRDYLSEIDLLVPSNVAEYVPHNGELEQILADVDACGVTGKLPRYLIGGPTGAGKTHLAQFIAAEREAPLFTLQMRYSVDEADLLGSPFITDNESMWVDGTLTKALLASKEREVVLLIDEANRARPDSKGVLFSALDDRCRIELDGPRGGEVIEGNARNLIVVSTINENTNGETGYHVHDIDTAERRRLGSKYDVDHLGIDHPAREAGVVTERSPVCGEFAHLLVKAANDVRAAASDPQNIKITTGVPTASVIEWAQTAYAFAEADISNPVMTAADSVIARRYYGDDADERREVLTLLRNYADGAPVDADALRAFLDDELVDEIDAAANAAA